MSLDDSQFRPPLRQFLTVTEECERRSSLVRRQRFVSTRGVGGKGLGGQIGPLVVKTPVGRPRDGGAIRIEHDDAPAWS
jgi:hypothetical protein